MNKSTLISVFKYVIGLGFGVLLFYLALRNVEWGDLQENLQTANYYWVGLGLGVALLSHYFRALRWVMLLKAANYKLRASTSFAAIMVGYMVNQAIPRAGEITRASMPVSTDDVPFTASLATIITDRVFDFICLGSLVAFMLIAEFGKIADFFIPALERLTELDTGWLVILGVFAFFGFLFGYLFFTGRILSSVGILEKIKAKGVEMWEAVLSIRKLENIPLFIFYSVGIWVCYILMTYLVFFSLDASSGLGLYFGLIAFTLGGIGMVVPSPGGIGSYHYAFSWAFGAFAAEIGLTYKAAMSLGNSLAIIIHTSQLVMMVLVGFIAYLFILWDRSRTLAKAD